MTEQENTIVLVENAIRKIGVDPAVCKGEKVGQYSLVQGSANVWIDVLFVARENSCYFQVMSPIMILHNVTNKVGLFEELLTINDTLYNVAFTLFNNFVWLKTIREVKGLDEDEILAQIRRIGTYGDQYDDYLKQKYEITNPASAGVVGRPPQ